MNQTVTVLPGQVYRHFKNRLYQVITVAKHTETGEKLVVYQALYGSFGIYARPYEMFISEVDRTRYSVTEYPQQYRFELVHAESLKENTETEETTSCIPLQKGRKQSHTAQALLMDFLDTDSYREKLDIMGRMGEDCTENIVNSMALSLDIGLKGTTVEECMEEIRKCLALHMKYEGRRD